VCSRPVKVRCTEDEEEQYNTTKLRKEREVSKAFLSYLSLKGEFEDWEKNKESFQRVHVSILLYQNEERLTSSRAKILSPYGKHF